MENLGIYIELKGGQFKKSNREILTLARRSGRPVVAVIFAASVEPYMDELRGVRTVIQVTGGEAEYQPDRYAETLAGIIAGHTLNDFLAACSAQGKDLFPRVAARLNAALVQDSLAINLAQRSAIKPVYAGKLLAEYQLAGDRRIYTVRPNVIPADGAPAAAPRPEVVTVAPTATDLRTRIVSVQRAGGSRVDLTEADIIVSGGRAMKSKENFAILEALADVLHAGVGASRAAVDAGYATSDMQVGQTGKVVNPKLYIACGISGSIQHFAGMKTSKVIVGINKDPEAPIFKKADYGIVGDLFVVVPPLTEAFKNAL